MKASYDELWWTLGGRLEDEWQMLSDFAKKTHVPPSVDSHLSLLALELQPSPHKKTLPWPFKISSGIM